MSSNVSTSPWRSIDPRELWTRRHLAVMLMVREIKVRYKQSALGASWAIIRPLLMMLVFTFLFGTVAQLPDQGVPYALYVFAALIAWDLFANIVLGSASSIVANRAVVQKIYCPRLLFPLSSVLVALFDYAIALALLAILLVVFGHVPSAQLIWLPLLSLGVIFVGLSLGLWVAAIAVWLHDVKFVIGYLLQIMLLLTPVGYGASAIPEHLSWMVAYNPVATMVEAFRWSILGVEPPMLSQIVTSGIVCSVMLIGGLLFFNALERSFADVA